MLRRNSDKAAVHRYSISRRTKTNEVTDMASTRVVHHVPATKRISAKYEEEDEINAMALKMKESYKRSATVISALRTHLNNASNYVNRTGKSVPIVATNSSPCGLPKGNTDKTKYAKEDESLKGKFGWQLIGSCQVPYIIRCINGERLKFVSVRMAETQLLSNYLYYLHADIYKFCTSVKSYFITENEAKLLNDININHSDQEYGMDTFVEGKDCVVNLEDVHEFYLFIEMCYKIFISNCTPDLNDKCGFIHINSQVVVPYSTKDGKKYIPLFFFEGDTADLKHESVKLENWELAYLKFCCKLQGIQSKLIESDINLVISYERMKIYFPSDTKFEFYWPTIVVDKQLTPNPKPDHVYPSGFWIKIPATLELDKTSISENLQHPSQATMPPPPPSIPIVNNCYQNGWPSNHQLDRSYIIQAHSSPPVCSYSVPSRNQNAPQYYNMQQNVQRPVVTNVQRTIITAPVTEIINSPLVSLVPPNMTGHSVEWELQSIPEHMWQQHALHSIPYKIQKARIKSKVVHCINAIAYDYSVLLVTLDELVQTVFPTATVERCARILTKFLNVNLYRGNSDQISVLRANGRISRVYLDETPMVILKDITDVFPQLKIHVCRQETQIHHFQSAGTPAKIQRIK